jgi:hypothetical protein
MTQAGHLAHKSCGATTAFFELVLRLASALTEVKSRQDIWKGPTWIRAIFCTGQAAEATRWTLEEMHGREAYFRPTASGACKAPQL